MTEEGIRLIRHLDLFEFDEINDFATVTVANEITKRKITIEEPHIRKGIVTHAR